MLFKLKWRGRKELFGLLAPPSSPSPVVFSEAANLTGVKLYLYHPLSPPPPPPASTMLS